MVQSEQRLHRHQERRRLHTELQWAFLWRRWLRWLVWHLSRRADVRERSVHERRLYTQLQWVVVRRRRLRRLVRHVPGWAELLRRPVHWRRDLRALHLLVGFVARQQLRPVRGPGLRARRLLLQHRLGLDLRRRGGIHLRAILLKIP